ncbi:hypothetical protein [Arthrobacter bambusae]|uniref:hypothetical protein n=1 Tax=Arthrobacter bambusae TaxID=1338426 RepID=UPI002780D551|nr:hypothetical protein [Arthrobacter bambusae]MDQ0241236.1 hypothetical protein [Arthrobacter bambusae]
MSKLLNLANDTLSYAPVFNGHALLASMAIAEDDRAAAARYLEKHAPDLRAMLLGGAA